MIINQKENSNYLLSIEIYQYSHVFKLDTTFGYTHL